MSNLATRWRKSCSSVSFLGYLWIYGGNIDDIRMDTSPNSSSAVFFYQSLHHRCDCEKVETHLSTSSPPPQHTPAPGGNLATGTAGFFLVRASDGGLEDTQRRRSENCLCIFLHVCETKFTLWVTVTCVSQNRTDTRWLLRVMSDWLKTPHCSVV